MNTPDFLTPQLAELIERTNHELRNTPYACADTVRGYGDICNQVRMAMAEIKQAEIIEMRK